MNDERKQIIRFNFTLMFFVAVFGFGAMLLLTWLDWASETSGPLIVLAASVGGGLVGIFVGLKREDARRG